MNDFKKILIFILFLSPVACPAAWAQQAAESKNIILQAPFSLKVGLIQENPDDKGTDVTNIYTIAVDYAQPQETENKPFTLIYYLDGRLVEDFKAVTLPFSFKRNFKGQESGTHEIRLEVEGIREDILASGTAIVEVIH